MFVPIAINFRCKEQISGTCGSIMENMADGFSDGRQHDIVHALTTAKREKEVLQLQLHRGLDILSFSEAFFNQLSSGSVLPVKKWHMYQLFKFVGI